MILLVEDDEDLRALYRVWVEVLWGYSDVREARNGVEAQALVEAHPTALVVTDIRMPGGDGLELIRWLRQRPRPPAIVVLSASDAHRSPVEADGIPFLLKPVEKAALRQAIVERIGPPPPER